MRRTLCIYAPSTIAAIAILFGGIIAQPSFVSAQEVAEAKTEEVKIFGEATMEVPSDFKRVPPKSRILEHEFEAKAGKGDDAKTARVTMMASGGGIEANIKRWEGQFTGGDAAAKKTEMIKVGNWKVHLVDTNGSFSERMGGGPFAGGKVVVRKDWGMAGAILEHPEGRTYFVKMIGPMEVVKANREAMVKMIKSLK